ncbi:MAG TPA: hypothetical protein VF188_16310 [Longimicrobiales bacterium]
MRILKTALATLFTVFLSVAAAAAQEAEPRVDAALLGGLSWRSIGPAMFGGRVADVAGVPGDPDILYVGAASSGLFKSTNGGITFESVFDSGNTLSIGAIAVQPDDPDVVYVGTGEGAVRNSISYGDGIYKTTDGGKTWVHLGLDDTERFSRIVIHPTDPRIVFAAAMGHAFGPNEERGVYRSTDGGVTWQRVLYVDETTGASDVAIDPEDPDIVYAGMYDYRRRPWHFRSGGPGSGLYRSTDGGDTWTKLTDPALDNGLPGGVLGRIGISIHRADPNVVYALIESTEGVLWRSDDRGITWRMVNDDRRLNNRPFYYTQVRADPVDPDRVYTLAGRFNVSTDGGRTFGPSGGRMFGDHHALWIDPLDPSRLLCGTDGGFFVSNDYGRHWDFLNNIPLAQAYHVGVDMAEPYNVAGGFQDHEIWRGPNEKWNRTGVRGGHWVRLRYMADGMYALPDPRDPNIIYYNGHFGDITRIDMRNAEERYIQPYPPGPAGGGANLEQYRFNWNSPIHMSPNDPDVIYYGGNVLFKTTDGGSTWTVISPDLTTDDPAKQQPSGGPITPDNTRAEFHSTILAIAESPRDPEVIWVGTDDGNVQLTRDGGKHWTNVAPNIEGAPAFSWVAAIRASHADAGTAYVAIDQHRMDDFTPYAFMTTDYGRTWRRISDGLRGYVHIVMEDPREPNLLYAGTELGIFVSFDRGASWTDFRLGLPPLAVRDMTVHPRDNDLVIATHARGFYILDDVTPLQGLARAVRLASAAAPGDNAAGASSGGVWDASFAVVRGGGSGVAPGGRSVGSGGDDPPSAPPGEAADADSGASKASGSDLGALGPVTLFEPMPAVRYTPASDVSQLSDDTWRARNQPYGVILSYYLAAAGGPDDDVRIDILDSAGRTLRTLEGTKRAGINRVVWDLGEASSCALAEGNARRGTWLRALPGEYTVRLTAFGRTVEQTARVRLDPRVHATDEDLAVWYREAHRIERMECTIDRAADRLRALERGLSALERDPTAADFRADVAAVRAALRPIRLGLIGGDPNDPGYVNLAGRVNWLPIQVGNYTGRPTAAQIEWIRKFGEQTERYVAQLAAVVDGRLAALNEKLRAAGRPAIAADAP